MKKLGKLKLDLKLEKMGSKALKGLCICWALDAAVLGVAIGKGLIHFCDYLNNSKYGIDEYAELEQPEGDHEFIDRKSDLKQVRTR